jgi:hypothetical protein
VPGRFGIDNVEQSAAYIAPFMRVAGRTPQLHWDRYGLADKIERLIQEG